MTALVEYRHRDGMTVYKIVVHPDRLEPAFARLFIRVGELVLAEAGRVAPRCRTARAEVLKIVDMNGEPLSFARSWWCVTHRQPFQYSLYKTVVAELSLSPEVCAPGIHFFLAPGALLANVSQYFPNFSPHLALGGVQEIQAS